VKSQRLAELIVPKILVEMQAIIRYDSCFSLGMKNLLLLVLLFTFNGYAQLDKWENEEEVVEEPYCQFPEIAPEFPGGFDSLKRYISKNLIYPEICIEMGIQGKVFVGFIVEKDGSVSNVKILRGIDPVMDREAKRCIRSLPKWTPGKCDGKIDRIKQVVPVIFELPEEKPITIVTEEEIVDFPDVDAKFPGGPVALFEFLSENMVYPDHIDPMENSRLIIEFVVEKDGSITNPIVQKGISAEMDKNAIELINKMPNWEPAKFQGKVVRSRVRIPFNINLK
jgi:TonB family protein